MSCNKITGVLSRDERPVTSLEFTLPGLLSVLSALGVTGYFYSNYSAVNGMRCLFCRYLSPDLFLHMDSSGNINLMNAYSEGFSASILPSRLARMVPFP